MTIFCYCAADVPFPLASKIYYSQRNNRLRSALGYLYWEAVASSKEICNMMDQQMTKENIKLFHSTSEEEESQEQTSDVIGNKVYTSIIFNVPFLYNF